jgi:hypothetical protein
MMNYECLMMNVGNAYMRSDLRKCWRVYEQ